MMKSDTFGQSRYSPRMGIPNILTSARFVLAFAGVAVLLWDFQSGLNIVVAAVIFLFAVISDWLDGFLARKLRQPSRFGAFMDPLADKMIVIPYMIILASWGYLLLGIVVLLVMRDLLHDGLRSFAAAKGVVIGANVASKAKTALQMIALLLLLGSLCVEQFLFTDPEFGGVWFMLSNTLLIGSLAFGVIGTIHLLQHTFAILTSGE